MVRADCSLGRRCISHWRYGTLYRRQRVHALPYSVPDIRVRKQAHEFPPWQHKAHNPARRFVVGLAITFRMQSSYNRWWDGRIQWDKLSADSRSFARTIWLHVPQPASLDEAVMIQDVARRTEVIRCVHTLAVALKHHLRGERDWSECRDLKQLCAHLPNVSI